MALERSKGWRGLAAWGRALALAAAVAAMPAAAQTPPVLIPPPPPAADFWRTPQIADLVLSPSGRRAAIVTHGPSGHRQLGVIDLQPLGKPRHLAGYADGDIRDVAWTSDDRLVYQVRQRGAVVESGGGGVFAIDHDGSAERLLIAWRWGIEMVGSARSNRTLPYGWELHSVTDDGSDDVYVTQRVYDQRDEFKELQISRLSTRTGELRNLNRGAPDGARQWLRDRQGVPRVMMARGGGRSRVFWQQPGAADWTEVASFEDFGTGSFAPWYLESETQMLVLARKASDTLALHRFDLARRSLDPTPLVAVKGFDLSPTLVNDSRSRALAGIHFVADRPMSYWFDDELARVQKSIDASLPAGRVNRLLCGRCSSSRMLGVASSSDRRPTEYYLFDRDKLTLSRLGGSRPWLDEASQGTRSFHRVAARDGLSLPVVVTHPPGSTRQQALPTVLLVHGGPWVRGGDLGWSAEAQFLATRGYRVLEPEFRGSTGFGWNHFRAGWKEWGGRMQDDLADTVQWAAQQGLVDPQRVCIMGASYGGYAALMAPIVHPGVFKCSVAFVAVTDIRLMYDVTWSDLSDEYKRHGMPKLIGSPEEDGALLDRASPLKRAAELKLPVLLVHGFEDRRVPMVHADRFAEAAKAAGVPLERLLYKDDGHGLYSPESQIDYHQKVEAFLGRHLGATAR